VPPARKAADPTERRGDRRIVLRRRAILSLTAPPQTENTPALVVDISCKGIGLLAVVPLEPGAHVALAWEFGARRDHRTITATVMHASQGPDKSCRVGCTFDTPLEKKDLRAFLRHCARL